MCLYTQYCSTGNFPDTQMKMKHFRDTDSLGQTKTYWYYIECLHGRLGLHAAIQVIGPHTKVAYHIKFIPLAIVVICTAALLLGFWFAFHLYVLAIFVSFRFNLLSFLFLLQTISNWW